MNTTDTLREAHRELRKAVPGTRRQAANDDGHLHALGKETFRLWDRMRDAGQSFQERCQFLEGVLRQILRFGREWKYLCQQCDDYGLIIADCGGDSACGRHRAHLPHVFGTPCTCAKGRAFEQPSKDVHPEDFTAAGRTAKPKSRQFRGFGR